MGVDAKRYIVPYVVGLAPALLVALSWAPSGGLSLLQASLRHHSFPIVGAELFAVAIALREGMLKALLRWNWSWPALLAVITLLAIAVTTAFFAPLRTNATILTAYWIIHGLFGLSILHLCGRMFQPSELVKAYMAGFGVFAVLFLLFLTQIPDWATFNWMSRFLSFNHVRHAGYYVAAMAALGIGAMAIAKGRIQWLCAWVLASFAFGMALWTGSRGAAIAVAGALLFCVVLVPAVRAVRGWLGGLAAMTTATAVVWLAPAAPHYLMGIARTVEATAKPDVTTGRTTMWKGVLGAIERRPLFGYGEGQMREVAPFSVMVQPHNSVLQVALAWGLIGLFCVIVIVVAFAMRAVPVVRRDQGALVPAAMALAAIAILSLYDGSLYYPLPTSIFVACAAMIASQWDSAKREPALAAPNHATVPASER